MANKVKRKNKKKLSSLILMLFLAAFMLTISTYAWFTSNKTVTISTLDVNVAAKNGLQISTDGTTWKTTITTDDITAGYAGHTNLLPTSLAPVSTGKTVTSGKLNMFFGTVETNTSGQYVLTSTTSAEDSGQYIVFDMFLQTGSDTDLYLTSGSNVSATDSQNDVGLQNASRVAFVVEGNTTSSNLDTIRALNSGTSTSTYIWEPNYDTHTDAGLNNARDTYAVTSSAQLATTGASAIGYEGVMATFNGITSNVLLTRSNSANFNTFFQAVTPDYRTPKTQTAYTQVFSLLQGVTKVRVYMWVEGQDVDCENSASGTNISYNVQLSVNPSTGGASSGA